MEEVERYETVNARIPAQHYITLDRYAKEDYSNISVVVRQAIAEYISRREKQQD